jgi:hypothetical protein
MEISTFASAPPANQNKPPFILSKSKIEAWLHSLPAQEAYSSCAQLLSVLQILNSKDLRSQKRLVAVETIGNYLDVFIKPIEKKFIDAGFPLNQEEADHIAMIIWTYGELAKGFSLCVSEKQLSSDENAFAIYNGLKALGNVLLYTSMAYESPYKGYWKLYYQLFQQAKQLNLLESDIHQNGVLVGRIDQVFKQILSFYHCGSNQLRPKEMKVIYQFLNGYGEKALIRAKINQKQAAYYTAFDVSQDQAPAKLINISKSTPDNIRYFSPINVAKAIARDIQKQPAGTDILHSVKIVLLNKMLKSLSLTQSRKFTRVKEDKSEYGVLGFSDSVQYLHTKESKTSPDEMVITEYDPRIAGIWTEPSLDLMPEGEEMVQKMWNTLKTGVEHDKKINQIFTTRKNIASSADIWAVTGKSAIPDDAVKFGEFSVNNSSINGYSMMLKNGYQVRTNINELIGFTNNEDDRIEIGLIRRINKTPNGGINFGIELMSLESQALSISKQHKLKDTFWALFLPGIQSLNKPDSIMFSSNIFALGDVICLHQGVDKIYCRLNTLLHETADIRHVEIHYPTPSSSANDSN